MLFNQLLIALPTLLFKCVHRKSDYNRIVRSFLLSISSTTGLWTRHASNCQNETNKGADYDRFCESHEFCVCLLKLLRSRGVSAILTTRLSLVVENRGPQINRARRNLSIEVFPF